MCDQMLIFINIIFMKKALFFILLIDVCFCNAQNYQCLQGGVKHYFTNGNGYLRGIRIDSVKTFPDSTIYYPFHTERGPWIIGLGGAGFVPVDTSGGSWLGKKVKQLNDGTFLFDNLWGDTVIIKTQASIGDSWTFCRDSSSLYYEASVTAIDTLTVLGFPDSVKKILIRATNGSGIVRTDPVDSSLIILSKNNGFVQVVDLYTFPFHKPDSSYILFEDYYLDHSLVTPNFYVSRLPDANNLTFKIIAFVNPTSNQLSEANIDDVFEIAHNYSIIGYTYPTTFKIDTIISKSISPPYTYYSYSGINGTSPYSGSYTTSDSYIYDTTKMPEERGSNFPNYYFPEDSSYCTISPAYETGWIYYEDGMFTVNKIGFGQTEILRQSGDPSYWDDRLIFSYKSGSPCGHYVSPFPPPVDSSVSVPKPNRYKNFYELYPNPSRTELTITSSGKITNISLSNILGQILYKEEENANELKIDVRNLQPGIYLVKINDSAIMKFIKE
jgi:hypothetical protein